MATFFNFDIKYLDFFNIVSISFSKPTPSMDEWLQFIDYFKLFFNNVKKKYVMIVNVSTLNMISPTKLKLYKEILIENRDKIDEYCIETRLIIATSLVKNLMKLFLSIYKNRKPVIINNTYDEAYNNVMDIVNKSKN